MVMLGSRDFTKVILALNTSPLHALKKLTISRVSTVLRIIASFKSLHMCLFTFIVDSRPNAAAIGCEDGTFKGLAVEEAQHSP
ncbi:hypothetical protein Mapa_012084 [Marchantia paleacea]|nr:hypothetical protein Mapa_012084 [Marchantia paleacea]